MAKLLCLLLRCSVDVSNPDVAQAIGGYLDRVDHPSIGLKTASGLTQGHDDPFFHTTLLKITLGFFASFLIAFVVSHVINFRRGVVRQVPRTAQAARLAMAVMAVLNIVFLVSLPHIFNFGDIAAGRVLPLKILLIIPIITSILVVSAAIFTVLAWKNKYWHIIERMHYTLVMFAGLSLIWSLNCWNLLGWRF